MARPAPALLAGDTHFVRPCCVPFLTTAAAGVPGFQVHRPRVRGPNGKAASGRLNPTGTGIDVTAAAGGSTGATSQATGSGSGESSGGSSDADGLRGLVFCYDTVHPDGLTGHRVMGEIAAHLILEAYGHVLAQRQGAAVGGELGVGAAWGGAFGGGMAAGASGEGGPAAAAGTGPAGGGAKWVPPPMLWDNYELSSNRLVGVWVGDGAPVPACPPPCSGASYAVVRL